MFYISLWASKLWFFVTHKFTTSDKCGMVALRLYDNFLKRVSKPPIVIAVTGTNGKTTTCNFLVDILTTSGYRVTSNKEGANLRPGISKALMRGVTIFNKCKVDVAVLEFDELSSKIILPLINPNYVVVTNLFRDTLKRNGHTEFVWNKINEGLPSNSTLILNADDLITASLGEKNKKVYFGIEKQKFEKDINNSLTIDIRLCPKCNNVLKYDFIRYHHIGSCSCSKCGYKNPLRNYTASLIDEKNNTVTINNKVYPLVSSSIFNVYNLLTAITVLKEMKVSDEKIINGIKSLNIVETRFKTIELNNKEIITHFLKGDNSVSCSRVFNYVSSLKGRITVILVIDDQHENINHGNSEFMSWMYDADYELLNKDSIDKIIIAGNRRYDEKVRFMMAGVNEEKCLLVREETECNKYIDYKNTDKIIILHDLYSVDIARTLVNNIKEDLK